MERETFKTRLGHVGKKRSIKASPTKPCSNVSIMVGVAAKASISSPIDPECIPLTRYFAYSAFVSATVSTTRAQIVEFTLYRTVAWISPPSAD